MRADAPRPAVPLRSVELAILLSTVNGPRHGYAILQDEDARTAGRPGFEIPTLYRALRRMRDTGLIVQVPDRSPEAEPRRQLWVATDLGRRALRDELRRLQALVAEGRGRIRRVSPQAG